MTRELEKEAEDFEASKHYRYEDNDYCGDIADGIIQAYIAGAEPRENRIAEAKEIIEKLLNALASNDFFDEEELEAMAEAERFIKRR